MKKESQLTKFVLLITLTLSFSISPLFSTPTAAAAASNLSIGGYTETSAVRVST